MDNFMVIAINCIYWIPNYYKLIRKDKKLDNFDISFQLTGVAFFSRGQAFYGVVIYALCLFVYEAIAQQRKLKLSDEDKHPELIEEKENKKEII